MEQIIAIIVFAALAAVTIYGYRQSSRAARGDFSHGSSMAMVGASRKDSPSAGGASPGRKTEDHATLSEVAEPKGMDKDKTTSPDTEADPGERRPQADRPLTSGDVGA